MRILCSAALLLLLLNACGAKGPLYLPQNPPPSQPSAQPSPDEVKKK